MKIAIFGSTLYAGVMATLFAECGHQVLWYDSDEIDDIEVAQRLLKQQNHGRLQYLADINHAQSLDVFLLCYRPTEQYQAQERIKQLSQLPINARALMMNGSTFGLQGTQQLREFLPHHLWVYLPDIIQEGNAIQSLLTAKQVMIGYDSHDAIEIMEELLRPLFNDAQRYLWMPILDAELAKLSISGMLATRISYMNDIAVMAEKLGVDIMNIKQGMAADSRIGATYLSPGVGFGGEHFSHDILTLSSEVSKSGTKSRLLSQVWQINEDQKEILFRKLWDHYGSNLKGKTVAIWGASFKENTANTHNSPIHVMLKALWAQGVKVQLHDPQALDEMKEQYGERDDLMYCSDQYDAVINVDALCIITAWKQYFSPDYEKLLSIMNTPLILDGRNIYNPSYMKSKGFIYSGVGR